MSYQRLLSIVSHLGGPDISPRDVEWVTDLPAGKQLMGWLENQLIVDLDVERGHNEMDWVAWEDITLERAEISSYVPPYNEVANIVYFGSLRTAEAFRLISSIESAPPDHPVYTRPSKIK